MFLIEPRMNADEHRSESVFICVHPWLKPCSCCACTNVYVRMSGLVYEHDLLSKRQLSDLQNSVLWFSQRLVILAGSFH